jgi:hypothetical protein
MKKIIIRYGTYAFLCAFLLFIVVLYVGLGLDFALQEVLGYLTIITSLVFIFPAVKSYRENVNNGVVSFKTGLLIGLAISALAGIGFAIADTLYLVFINPDFAQQYFEYSVEKMENELPLAEFEIKKAELEGQIAQYSNPAFNAIVMFLTVFLIGTLISIISAFILQRKK